MEQRKLPTQLKQGLQHAISYVVESKENYVRRPGKARKLRHIAVLFHNGKASQNRGQSQKKFMGVIPHGKYQLFHFTVFFRLWLNHRRSRCA